MPSCPGLTQYFFEYLLSDLNFVVLDANLHFAFTLRHLFAYINWQRRPALNQKASKCPINANCFCIYVVTDVSNDLRKFNFWPFYKDYGICEHSRKYFNRVQLINFSKHSIYNSISLTVCFSMSNGSVRWKYRIRP